MIAALRLKVYYYKKVGLGDLSPREFECASKKIFFGSLKKIPDPKKIGLYLKYNKHMGCKIWSGEKK